ncbi:Mucin-5AC [Rhodotorula toruloides ATCC 204091]|uniref:Mucin-5AC n=1 Tax=Rhodotorula toruloides TaxID=5286 RepID=A0A0K3CRM7_RHOTO|nr:Mucin-5AC [Rhodotorula toruloides ATCC 204091]PRQ69974.1 mucin-5AC [Rhodotorula toruloides]
MQSAERSRNSFRTCLRRLRVPARFEASAPPPPYSPPASPLVESKKDLRGTLPLNIIFFDIPTPITITENNSREWVKALRDFAYSSVHHDQLAKVLGRVLGEAWDRLDAESRPRRRPACEDVVNYLRQSFPEYRDACTYRLLFHIYFAHQLARAVARYLLGIPEAGSSTSHPALLYPDIGFALEAQLHGAFLLFQCSEDRLSFDLRRDHAFFIEDPSRPGSAYVLPDDVLTDWANDVVEDLSNNCILRKPAIDFSLPKSSTHARLDRLGLLVHRLKGTRGWLLEVCVVGDRSVQRLAQEERDSS